MTVQICLALLGIAIAVAMVVQGPPLVASMLARLIRRCIDREIAADAALLVADRAPPVDRWAPISRADRRLLSHALSLSVRSTVLTSGLPHHAG